MQLIRLSNSTATFAGQLALATGWGRDSDDATAISSVLRQVNLTVREVSYCRTYYGNVINDNLICTSGQSIQGDRGTCQGDSGGPLVLGGEQVINSSIFVIKHYVVKCDFIS